MSSSVNVHHALMRRLEEVLTNVTVGDKGKERPFQFFRHRLPEQSIETKDEYNYAEKRGNNALYPFCVVRIDTGSKGANHDMQITRYQVLIGVEHNGKNSEGDDDVMTAIEAIWQSLNDLPIIEKRYRVQYPIDFALSEENHHPFYYGGMQLDFEHLAMMDFKNTDF